jgi:hypothetical protein
MQTKKRDSLKDTDLVSDESIYKKIGDSYHSVVASSASFKAAALNDPLRQLKLGCEHEFFLIDKDGSPCSLDQSQEFLLKLSELPKWKIFRPADKTSRYIYRVSNDLPDGNYHSVKYEHPPHLLELALAPTSSLIEFREKIFRLWGDLTVAAHRAQLNFISTPFISPPKVDWEIVSLIDEQYLKLKRSRELLVQSEDINKPWVNFTTYTAATQFHIGGHQWWNQNSNLIRSLYRTELAVGSKPYEKIPSGISSRSEFFLRRWSGYSNVFKSSSLVGFPKIGEWTLRKWIAAFSQSSLIVGENDPMEGKTLFSITEKDNEFDLTAILPKVRDLQIIKPKLIGTLEFRADPALPTPEAITNQAALRFGAFLLCLKDHHEPFQELQYSAVCERWWNNIDLTGVEHSSENIIELIWQSLRERGLGEEGLL